MGPIWSRNLLTSDSKPNLTMINEDVCETEQSSIAGGSNAKGSSYLCTFASVSKKISADWSYDPMTSGGELTTGSSRRHARLYKRDNGMQAYKTHKDGGKSSDPISKINSPTFSANGSEDSGRSGSFANMINSAQLLFATGESSSRSPMRNRNGSVCLQDELYIGLLAEGRKTPNDE